MKKLLASDVDGTLYVNQKIHNKSLDYIKKFREQGNIFLLCTGRNFGGVKHLFEEYDIEVDGFVLCNGAIVLDKELNTIHNTSIDDETIKALFEEAKDNSIYNFYFADGENLYIIDGYNSHPIISSVDMTNKMNIIKIKESDFYKNSYCANIVGIDIKDECINKANDKKVDIEKKFSEKVSVYRNLSFIDIVPKNTSKGEGINKVLNKFGVKEDNVFVIGDSWNDLSMFEKYKNSYTFSYSEESLKVHAKNIVDNFYDCIEDAIK
ncbi:cof family hydrolase [[Clostridium] sordellii]|uniref:Cof-type HAD-IIB family hydrolase n=1 Tax=Paraclostridium sordellii TaxID=1505 RepID=UPI0005E2E1A9|nr:HAD family hydrolase [Paeniclostridium sordellii]CEP90088.1 cof family hydrolase [[Clostridium] sordellii] [Paeniclostridium sordellii]